MEGVVFNYSVINTSHFVMYISILKRIQLGSTKLQTQLKIKGRSKNVYIFKTQNK